MLFRREPEGVVPHRVQNVVPSHSFVTSKDISSDVTQRVSHMQASSRGIREHVHNEQLLTLTLIRD